jgi:hypothetical protein
MIQVERLKIARASCVEFDSIMSVLLLGSSTDEERLVLERGARKCCREMSALMREGVNYAELKAVLIKKGAKLEGGVLALREGKEGIEGSM